MKKLTILIVFTQLIILPLWAQKTDSISTAGVRVIARAQEGKTLLRWAIDTPVAWQKNTLFGYAVERYTVFRNNQRIPPEKVVLTAKIVPKPLEEWQTIATENDYAAILAQAIYGESFEVGGEEDSLMQIVNKAEELEQRFSFALFAADMNFEAAKMAGIGFEDNTIRPNERYLYKVKPLIPTEKAAIEEGIVYIKSSDNDALAAPIDLMGVFNDKQVMLTWEYELFKSIYTSYYVEKSEDGINFHRLTTTPLVNLNDKPDAPAKRMYYVDSLAQNNKTYHYRVLGISPFGEIGQPSLQISGQGQKALNVAPRISNYQFIGEHGATLSWEFPKEAEKLITGFELNWAATASGPFKTVQKDIAVSKREILYTALKPSNYFTISALGKNDTKRTSMVKFVQPIDSIPPMPPIEVKGQIDSLGVVTLNWKPNEEEDILGYRIFRGNIAKEDFSQLTRSPISTTQFADSVQLESLNSKVYYTVVAVDKRYNMSDYSEVLTVKKPDVVPPSSPIFKDFEVANGGVWLQWINSPNDDVAKHTLYRQDLNTEFKKWLPIFETDTTTTFTDYKVEKDKKYRYAIFAEDESGLISNPSAPLTVTVFDLTPPDIIKGLNTTINRQDNYIELYWKTIKNKDVAEVLVYKEKTAAKPVLIKQVPVKITRIIDPHLTPNNSYTYHLRAVFKNGSYSKIKSITVNY